MADLHGVPVTIEGAECPDDDGGCRLVARKCCGTGCHWDDVRQCVNCGAFGVDEDAHEMAAKGDGELKVPL